MSLPLEDLHHSSTDCHPSVSHPFLLHSLVECIGRLRGVFFIHFFIFAFVNRNTGNLFSSSVQGPAPLTEDEPLAEMHLNALCRYSLSETSVCHEKLFMKNYYLGSYSFIEELHSLKAVFSTKLYRNESAVGHIPDTLCINCGV